ncbi:AI-2E family transporter [Halobacillus dabanensis]|uniref:AI-2E family transporter n=1 Tax=Halobacillus dabanensis TaxID=240302 RepID=UPI000943C525
MPKIIPVFVSDRVSVFRSELYRTIKGIIKAQCTLVMISAIIIATGLYFIGASHVLTITLLTAFVDFIPYVGTGIVFLPWILYQFFSGDFAMTICLSILYMVVMVTRQALEPKLLATHFGVPPILLLISLFLGFQLFGGFGMLISPIILMIVQTIHKSGVGREVWIYIKGN